MSLIRKVARPLLGASFIAGGIERLRSAEKAGDELEPTLKEVASYLPQAESLADNPQLAAQILGGVQVAAGAALALGKFPRLAALTLVGAHGLNAYSEYRTADLSDAEAVSAQRKTLLKNVSLLGGLGLAVADLAGKPSLSWRAEHVAKDVRKKGGAFRKKTQEWAEDLGDDAAKTLKGLEKDARKNFRRAEKEAIRAVTKGSKELEKVKGS